MDLWRKIRYSILLIVAIMFIPALVTLWNQGTLHREFDNLSTCWDLEEYLLEARRHEKNYLLRFDTEYIDLQAGYHRSLKDAIERLRQNLLIEDRIGALVDAADDYQRRFTDIADRIRNGDREAAEGIAMDEMIESARHCESLIRDLRDLTIERFEAIATRTQFVNVFSLLAALLAAVIVSGYITDKIVAWTVARERP
jgi:hypothetical protein